LPCFKDLLSFKCRCKFGPRGVPVFLELLVLGGGETRTKVVIGIATIAPADLAVQGLGVEVIQPVLRSIHSIASTLAVFGEWRMRSAYATVPGRRWSREAYMVVSES
jgi:hypothetical protein